MGRKMSENDIEVEEENGDVDPKGPMSYEEKLKYANAIAQPMASKKLTKKILKLVLKAKTQKSYVRFGLKDVQRRIRKGETGIVIFAGDVTPIDVMCHLPGVCEEKSIPYCYIPSKKDLASALGCSESCIVALVREHDDYKKPYDECYEAFKTLGNAIL